MIRQVLSRPLQQSNKIVYSSVYNKTETKKAAVQKKEAPKQQQKQVQQSNKVESSGIPEYRTPDFNKFANLEYKKVRTDIPHNDPKSPEYVPSERDDDLHQKFVEEHNKWIQDIKRDLETQKKIHNILQKMDRPYLRGLPGQTKNISTGLVDNFKPHNVPEGKSPETKASEFLEANFRNENRWTDQSVFHPKYAKMSHYDIDWQKELDQRPVNKNFHPDKGYKYDVETDFQDRHPYLADRLGHPEILGNPFERLMRLEGEMFHPNYLDQPHVQMPGTSPHPSLNFEPGEVVYENTRLLEWAKFWKASGLFGLAWGAIFVPYQLLLKTHMPMEMATEGIFTPYYQRTWFFWDTNQLHIPVTAGTIAYTLYIATSYAHRISKDYVVRMQYSKDKELLFVTTSSPYGSTEEHVYEASHVEFLPPSVKSGVQHMSMQDNDGLIEATCMNTHQPLVFYQDDKYWNPQLKEEFIGNSKNLWTKDYVGFNRHEEKERILRESITLGDTSSQAKIAAQ